MIDDKIRAEVKRVGLYCAISEMLDDLRYDTEQAVADCDLLWTDRMKIEDVEKKIEELRDAIAVYTADKASDIREFEKHFNIVLEYILSEEQSNIPTTVWKATAEAYRMMGQLKKDSEKDADEEE